MEHMILAVVVGISVFAIMNYLEKTPCENEVQEKELEIKPEPAEKKTGYPVGNLLETYRYVGKTADEKKIPQRYRRPDCLGYSVDLVGQLNGKYETGQLYIDEDPQKKNMRVSYLSMEIRHSDYETCRSELVKYFGAPINETIVPATKLENASMRCDFSRYGVYARLQSDNARDFISIIYTPE